MILRRWIRPKLDGNGCCYQTMVRNTCTVDNMDFLDWLADIGGNLPKVESLVFIRLHVAWDRTQDAHRRTHSSGPQRASMPESNTMMVVAVHDKPVARTSDNYLALRSSDPLRDNGKQASPHHSVSCKRLCFVPCDPSFVQIISPGWSLCLLRSSSYFLVFSWYPM